jgi:large conductance mechanosensitive channel
LKSTVDGSPAVLLRYGAFIQAAFDFAIIALAMFLLIKGMNALKRKKETVPVAPPKPSAEELLLAEIRDLLKKN